MTNFAMLDLETMGVCPSSIILSVGVVIFDDFYKIIDKKMWVLDKKEQLQLKRTYNENTLTFWKNQPKEAKEQFNTKEIYSVNRFKEDFYIYIKKFNIDSVWTSAPVLDVGCLHTLYGDGDYLPWKYNQVRCLRTIRDYMKEFPKRDGDNIHHDCLDDCEYQILCLRQSINDMLLYGYNEVMKVKNEK